MRVLVTGASGFLGSEVVRQLLDHGHSVRAVVRSSARVPPLEWRNRAEIAYADLEISPALDKLFVGVDVLIHLAAMMRGNADEKIAKTTMSTERLLAAMRSAGSTRHLVLASSCSVYDHTATHGILDEKSPLETKYYDKDGYTTAKMLQEHTARRFAEDNRWTLAVLRPGFIYGPGASPAAVAGIALGRVFLVFAPLAHLRLTHVDNCAGVFVNAAEKRIAGTFNIIDDDRVSAWRYAGRLKRRERSYLRIPMPYYVGLSIAYLASMAGLMLPPNKVRKLPGILNPRQYRARFKPLQYDNCRAKEELGWKCKPLFETGCNVT